MRCFLETAILLATTMMLAACARTQTPMTHGDVPRDGRGLPVWSEVMKKATDPNLTPGAGRSAPVASR